LRQEVHIPHRKFTFQACNMITAMICSRNKRSNDFRPPPPCWWNVPLIGYYAASCGNCLPTFRDNVSVPSLRVKSRTLDPWIFWDTRPVVWRIHSCTLNKRRRRRRRQRSFETLVIFCQTTWCSQKTVMSTWKSHIVEHAYVNLMSNLTHRFEVEFVLSGLRTTGCIYIYIYIYIYITARWVHPFVRPALFLPKATSYKKVIINKYFSCRDTPGRLLFSKWSRGCPEYVRHPFFPKFCTLIQQTFLSVHVTLLYLSDWEGTVCLKLSL
jgi:hypothetical protein